MRIEPAVTRRTLIVAGAATAGVATLAACSGNSNGSSGSSSGAASAGTASASSNSPSGAGSGSGTLAALADLTIGEPKAVDLPAGKKGLLTRTSQTAVVCFSTVCTHEGCTVRPDGTQLSCPCHGSVFAAATGAPMRGPATSPLATVAVKIVDGQVVTA